MTRQLEEDLYSLWHTDRVAAADQLNVKLGGDHFQSNTIPSYFVGKRDAATVFVMLNPGHSDPHFRFSEKVKQSFSTLGEYKSKLIENAINYGEHDRRRLDSFDVKQAVFLLGFPDPSLQLFPQFWYSKEGKLEAKREVLMNKYQLELVPYASRTFTGILDSEKQANDNFPALENFLYRLLDEITLYERRFVIFGSRQFYFLFRAAANRSPGNVFTESTGIFLYNTGRLSLRCSGIHIRYGRYPFTACIAHSFPSRALPNAHEKMAAYGRFCYENIYFNK